MDTVLPSPRKVAYNRAALSKLMKSSPIKLFLLGMPAAGKSYWSQVLKKELSLPDYDLDMLVSTMDERSVEEIFAEDGEIYFRKAETKMLRLFADKKQFILATGGGTPCHSDNMEWMNKQGITIWINEPIHVLTQRIVSDTTQRPLLHKKQGNELSDYLSKTLEQRQSFYETAKHTVGGESLSATTFAEIIQQYV